MKRIRFFILMFLSVFVFCLVSVSEAAPEDEGMPAVKVSTRKLGVQGISIFPTSSKTRTWSTTLEFPGTVVSAEGTWQSSSGFVRGSDLPYIVSRNRIKGRGNTITIGGTRPTSFGFFAPSAALVTVKAEYISEPPRIEADVNTDNIVNIQDLIFISQNFGELRQTSNISFDSIKNIGRFTWELARHSADVNWDGVVNILDLVLVAGTLDAAGAAPSVHTQALETLRAAEVQQWFIQAQQLVPIDVPSQKGIAVLEQLLSVLTPQKTELLPNYPNPFNPETWIPYHLSEPADVTLTIYSVDGTLVRTLALGHQPAGIYENKSRAAYWDGRNAVGERVAGGLYFYMLTAGDFAATGKMLIRK